MSFERFFRMPLSLFLGFNLRTLYADYRVKLGQELTGSTYGNCANLALRCCNVPIPIATSQEGLCSSLVAAVMADAAGATQSVLPKIVR